MVQIQSWEGKATKWYEKRLGLDGGYARRITSYRPSSIANSEYVVSSPNGLKIIARGGGRITPIFYPKEAHYTHSYGNPNLVSERERTIFLRRRQQFLKRMRKRG